MFAIKLEEEDAKQRRGSVFWHGYREIKSKLEKLCLDLREKRHRKLQSDISNLLRVFSLIRLRADS